MDDLSRRIKKLFTKHKHIVEQEHTEQINGISTTSWHLSQNGLIAPSKTNGTDMLYMYMYLYK